MRNKVIISSKHIKRIFACLVLLLIGLVLSSCDSSNRKATGGIDTNATYATAGNYTVTVGEVYDELRYGAVSYLEKRVNEIILADEIEQLKKDLASDNSKFLEKMNDTVKEDIYETSDDEEIADMDEEHLNHHITEFIDKVKQEGYIISEEDIKAENFKAVYPMFYVDLAKFVLGYNKLAEEFGKNADGSINYGDLKAEDAKITEGNVIDYYKDNYQNRGEVTGILVRFLSSDEAKQVLKTFGIMASNSKWYQIELVDDADNNPTESKIKYEKYYDDFKIDQSGIGSIEVTGAGMSTILKIYAAVYNYIYSYRDPIILDEELTLDTFKATYEGPAHLMYYNYVKAIIDKDVAFKENATEEQLKEHYNSLVQKLVAYDETSEDELTVLSYDRLGQYNTTLRTYVYETLATESKDGSAYTQYIASSTSNGSYYYLFFKASQEADVELYTEKTENDETTYTFTNDELKNEILAKVFEEKVSDTYVTEAYDERVKEADLSIYDSTIELLFMQGSSTLVTNYSKTRSSDKNNVAMVKYNKEKHYITAVELFNDLEPINGPTTAQSLLFDKFIKDQDFYKELEKNYDSYQNSVEMLLTYFANDYYSSSGYPSTLGKYKFLRLIYRSANMDEIIHDVLMLSDAKSMFFRDYTKFFTEEEFLNKLVAYAHESYTDFYQLTATKINVYADHNEDGKNDTIEGEISTLANELMEMILDYVKRSTSSYSSAISSFISEYNATDRFGEEDNPTANETKWAKYRQAGLYVTTESLSSINKDSEIDETTKEMIEELYADETVMDPDYGFISSFLTSKIYLADDNTNVSTLLVTGGTMRQSAKYEDEELIKKLYSTIPTIFLNKLVVTNLTKEDFANDEVNKNLVKAYLYDYYLNSSVESLPSSTLSALSTYVLPLIQRYASTASHLVITQNTLGEITFNYNAKCTCGNEEFNNGYSRSQYLNDYIEYQKVLLDDYKEVYPTWWNTMYGQLKEAK